MTQSKLVKNEIDWNDIMQNEKDVINKQGNFFKVNQY